MSCLGRIRVLKSYYTGPMLLKLILLFIGVPLLEVSILIKLGAEIGFWPTILIQVVTGVVGASLARFEGLRVWTGIQDSLGKGEVPAEKMLDGLMILAAGLVLLTPGLLSDALGLFLLFPWTRSLFKHYMRRRFTRMAQHRRTGFTILID